MFLVYVVEVGIVLDLFLNIGKNRARVFLIKFSNKKKSILRHG